MFRVNALASQQLLLDDDRGHGQLRQRWEEAYLPPEAAPPLPLGLDLLLPPAPGQDPAEAFDLAFLETTTPDEVAARLGLEPADAAGLARRLAARAAAVEDGLAAAGRFEDLVARLQRLAEAADLEGFLARAARFYGVEDRSPPTIHVELLWTPSDEPFLLARQVGSHMVIPVPRGWGESDHEAAALLATVVHELGHFFVALLPHDVRAAVARTLVDREGVLNAGRPNVFDEALQTALGTLVFQRDRLPASFDPQEPLYGADEGETYPDAIDALARDLEAPLRAHLDAPAGFTRGFLDAGLEAQARRFGRRPLHFTRSCLVHAPSSAALFRRAFPEGPLDGEAREVLDDEERFSRRSQELPTSTRWLLLLQDDLTRRPDLLDDLDADWARALALEGAVAQARRRAAGAGYDVVILARDADAMRRALLALREARSLPEREALRLQ